MKPSLPVQHRLCWLYALLMTAVLFAFALTFTNVQYGTNDDAGIMRAFLGYATGTPVSIHIYIHGLLAWPLYWLSCAFPGQPWFTWVQLWLLALALTVVVKGVLQLFVHHEKPLWAGVLLAAAFLLTPGLKAVSRLTFTQTAAMLGMAAVMQMLSVDHSQKNRCVITGMAGATALLLLSYALRQQTLLPQLAFCGLVFLFIVEQNYGLGKHARRNLRPMLFSLLTAAAATVFMLGVRYWEEQQISEYIAWSNARAALLDYTDLNLISQEALASVGWSHETFRLFQKWCFLDSSITTESLLALAQSAAVREVSSFEAQLSQLWETLKTLVRQSRADIAGLCWFAIAGVFVLTGVLSRRQQNRSLLWFVAAALSGMTAMLLYLAWGNYLPLRAVMVVIFPAAAILFAVLPACGSTKNRVFVPLCCILCALYAAVSAAASLPQLLPVQDAANPMADLEEYALWEPENLFIHDHSLVGRDVDAFPDYSEGVPHNVTGWGGWEMRSPQSIKQFANFGVDLLQFEPEILLREDVFIASKRSDGPLSQLVNWVKAELGPDVECEFWAENGSIYIYHFVDNGA